MPLTKLCDESKRMMLTELIGLGETERKIYDALRGEPEFEELEELGIFGYHEKHLQGLIDYQNRHNGN